MEFSLEKNGTVDPTQTNHSTTHPNEWGLVLWTTTTLTQTNRSTTQRAAPTSGVWYYGLNSPNPNPNEP